MEAKGQRLTRQCPQCHHWVWCEDPHCRGAELLPIAADAEDEVEAERKRANG